MARWFDGLFRRKPKATKYAPTFDGFTPWYSYFGDDIYASDVVRQAMKCIVDEMKKLRPMHVRYRNSDPVPVEGSTVQDVLNEPNELMTTTEFLEKIVFTLLMNDNAFVIPVYSTWVDEKTKAERRYYEALYPIAPTNSVFIEDGSGRLFVTFTFWNGYETTIPYDDVIHIREEYALSEYVGGNRFGQPDHEPLLKTLRLNDDLMNGMSKAMKASYAVNGVVKYNTIMDGEKTKNALRDLENKLRNNESGFLPIDLKSEFIPLPHESKIVDADMLKFIDEKILRTWGISLPILTGDYTKEQYDAFFQKSIEPRVKAISQAFTKKLFTKREKAFGNRIELYTEELVFMTQEQKLRVIETLSPTGGLMENEKRTILGFAPLPELEGKRYASLNWIDANNMGQYQVGENVEVVDEEKEDI